MKYIIGGTASQTIALDLAKLLKGKLVDTISKRFPDNELYVKINEDIEDKEIIIVQTTYPDQNIIELFLLQNAVEEAGAKTITVVIPYYGYGRQDKKFQDGEAISAKALAGLISLNADKIITVDPHKEHILDFFSAPAYSCSAVPEIAKYLKKKDIDVILAPDKGAIDRAKDAARIIGCEFDYMEKTRIDETTVEIKPKNLDVENKNVAIVDDIISTGGTMAKSIKELKNQGAKRVIVACTHGLFANGAIKKLHAARCDEIISTDTILSDYSKVRVAPAIVELI